MHGASELQWQRSRLAACSQQETKVVHMAKHPLHVFRAAHSPPSRLRRLADQLDVLLVGAFPHFRDAFDVDRLPLDFILKRDSGLPQTILKWRTSANGVLRRRRTTYRRLRWPRCHVFGGAHSNLQRSRDTSCQSLRLIGDGRKVGPCGSSVQHQSYSSSR